MGKDARASGVLSKTPQFWGVQNCTAAFGVALGIRARMVGLGGGPERDILVLGVGDPVGCRMGS